MNSMLKYNKCRACNSESITPWLALPSSPVANALFSEPDSTRHPLELNNCLECGHLQLASAPDPDDVFRGYKYKSGVSASFRKHFKEYAFDIINKYGFGKTSSVLEIGSNDGYLLEQFKKQGCNVIGVEPSIHMAQEHDALGVPVVIGFFNSVMVDRYNWNNHYDYICANNVLAHIPDMWDVISGISKALRVGGKLVVECGDQEGIINGKYLDNVYHEHIDYYSSYSFAKLLARANLKVLSVQPVNTHGLSFRIVAEKVHSIISVTRNKPIVDWNKAKQDVEDLIEAREKKMCALLDDRKYVAYGAAAKAVTSLYMLGLVKDLIGVVDDNELKQGYFFPGTDVTITSPDELDKDALVLVTAWNVFEDIKAKLVARGHRGEIICMQ
jgi:SAM-dependent methyltransferase